MLNPKSFEQQKYLLLAATLSILAVAMLLLTLHEQTHHDLFRQIGDHQRIVYHVGKAREELGDIELQLELRRVLHQLDAVDAEALALISSSGGFDHSVSIHTLQRNTAELIRLQKAIDDHGPVSQKLERQLDELLAPGGHLNMGDGTGLERLGRQIDGMILSMEQLEGLHSLRIKALTAHQVEGARRDTIVLIFMVSMLVLLSYLSITWIMGRVRSMVEEQRTLARELERQNAELERFTYTVSHDLKSPLVTIKNFIGMLERNVRADDRRSAYQDLERISAAADDMAALLEGLLELSRIGRIVNPPQSGRLNELVEKAVDKLRAKIETRGVELRIDPDMPDYWGDALRLQEVLQNLIENAVKFMGDQAEPSVRISAREEGGEVVCSVIDNGIGIEPQYNSRVFNLFERLDHKVEGTGIGLALAQRIVEAHHGRIWIESDAGHPGCTVVFTLPVKPAGSVSSAP